MLNQAAQYSDHLRYYGFDLFHDADLDSNKREFNGKGPGNREDVFARVHALEQDHPGKNFEIHLTQGDTRLTLANGIGLPQENVDFAFIDGGHSVETIKSDYMALKDRAKIILFDDFYVPNEENYPDVTLYGCNQLAEELGEKATILPIAENLKEGFAIKMMLVNNG